MLAVGGAERLLAADVPLVDLSGDPRNGIVDEEAACLCDQVKSFDDRVFHAVWLDELDHAHVAADLLQILWSARAFEVEHAQRFSGGLLIVRGDLICESGLTNTFVAVDL